jgi:hypothetical protein
MEALKRLGTLERGLGDEASARRYFERALAVAEGVFGPDHAETTKIRAQLAKGAPAGQATLRQTP